MDFLKTYGTEGPLGFPMADKQARIADSNIQVLERWVEENHVRDAADIQRS